MRVRALFGELGELGSLANARILPVNVIPCQMADQSLTARNRWYDFVAFEAVSWVFGEINDDR